VYRPFKFNIGDILEATSYYDDGTSCTLYYVVIRTERSYFPKNTRGKPIKFYILANVDAEGLDGRRESCYLDNSHNKWDETYRRVGRINA
jgi:hypothetical protein